MAKFIKSFLFLLFAINSSAVSIHVQDSIGNPIPDATVCLGVQTTLYAKTDSGGDAVISQPSDDNYLFIARHYNYGRTNPQYINTATQSNLIFVLPPITCLRVATYNMKGNDYWDNSQIQPLAKTFWTVQPDVVCLQECPEAGLLFEEFQKIYMPDYTSIVSKFGYYVYNGFLSFYPIESSWSYGISVMTRDLLSATIDVPGSLPITFLSAHFKCCSGDYEGNKRNEEAQFVAEHCSNLYAQGKMFLFGGDLNDDPGHPRPPSRVHSILLISNPAANLVQMDIRDERNNIDTYVGYTDRRYDFLYPVNALTANFIEGSVFRTETMTNRPAWLAYNESELASDHRMVYADFNIVPEPGIVWIFGLLEFWIIGRIFIEI